MEVEKKNKAKKGQSTNNKKRKFDDVSKDNSPAKKVKIQNETTKNQVSTKNETSKNQVNTKKSAEPSESNNNTNKNSPKAKNNKKNEKAKKPRISDGCRILICEMPSETSKKEIMAFLKSAGMIFLFYLQLIAAVFLILFFHLYLFVLSPISSFFWVPFF